MSTNGLEFWFETIGKRLNPEASRAEECTNMSVMTKTKNGLEPIRIGVSPIFYVGSRDKAVIWGNIVADGCPTLAVKMTMVGEQKFSARKGLAKYLVEEATFPLIAGSIGKSDPTPSFAVSNSPELITVCIADASFSANLSVVRNAAKLIGDRTWTKVGSALHAHKDMVFDRGAGKDRLIALMKKDPWIADVLGKINVQAGSGEYTLLSWYFMKGEVA